MTERVQEIFVANDSTEYSLLFIHRACVSVVCYAGQNLRSMDSCVYRTSYPKRIKACQLVQLLAMLEVVPWNVLEAPALRDTVCTHHLAGRSDGGSQLEAAAKPIRLQHGER